MTEPAEPSQPSGDPSVRQDVRAGRDVHVAGRDIYLTSKRSLDDEVATFESRNSRKRADILTRYAADDETLKDATVLLRRASLEAVSATLRILLARTGAEQDLALSLLDYLDESRTRDLVDLLKPEFPFLEFFPQAMEEISEVRRKTSRVDDGTGRTARAWESERGTQGFCRSYENDRIYWSRNGGTHACYGEINTYYDDHGGSRGTLGFPLSAEDRAEPWAPPTDSEGRETEGKYQRFEGPSDYSDETCALLNEGLKCGATVYWSKEFGAHGTAGPIGELYELNNGTSGWLGFPVEDEVQVRSKAGTSALRQRFQGGVIYYRDTTGAIPVPYPMAACHNWDSRQNDTRLPEGPREEVDAANSSGTRGYRQQFERRVTVYESKHGVYIVGWGNRTCYDKLGGPGSWLGFPKSEEDPNQVSTEGSHPSIQEFEGGAIYYKDEYGKYGSIPIPGTVLESIAEHGLLERMGFPVPKDYSLGSSPADRIYFFEHGIVTVRDGAVEPWLPPGLSAPS
jgi:uncharacterized protein with LGFP repeats